MNVIIQPVHLLLYMALVSTASDLVTRNPIYALVAIGFLIPAEKFIKEMFGLNKASSTSDFGSFAKNALAYEGLKKLGSAVSGGARKSPKNIKGGSSNEQETESSNFNKIRRNELGEFAKNNEYEENDENVDNSDSYGSKTLSDDQQKALRLEEKKKLAQELDEYENNGGDIYSSTDPSIQEKQLRYQELEKQENEERLSMQHNQNGIGEPERTENIQRQEGKGTLKNNNNNQKLPRDGYKKRIVGKTAKTLGKGLYKGIKVATKGALKTGFVGGGAVIGLASAIATGDASNVGKFALSGAYAGNALGNSVTRLPENLYSKGKETYHSAVNTYDRALDSINDEMYGTSASREMRNERLNARERKKFLKDKEQIRKCTELKRDIGYDGDIKDFMNAYADYKEAGVSDEMTRNALKVEQKRDHTIGGANHNKMIDVASFATENGYKKSDIMGAKSRSDMEDVVQATVAEKDRYEVMKSIADLYGQGEFYSKKTRFNKPVSRSKSTSKTTSNPSKSAK